MLRNNYIYNTQNNSKRQSINGKEFDTYKVGTVANSCSTMHKIADKEFTFEDFSHEKLINSACMEIQEQHIRISPIQTLATTIECLNSYRDLYLQTKDKNIGGR